jgi:hypothetical protein
MDRFIPLTIGTFFFGLYIWALLINLLSKKVRETPRQRQQNFRFIGFNFLLAFLALNISLNSEVVKMNNGLLESFSHSFKYLSSTINCLKYNFPTYEISNKDFISHIIKNESDSSIVDDSNLKISDSIYCDYALDISLSQKCPVDCEVKEINSRISEITSFLINYKKDSVTSNFEKTKFSTTSHPDSISKKLSKLMNSSMKDLLSYMHYSRKQCLNKCSFPHYKYGKYNINKISLCYNLIRQYFRSQLYTIKPFARLWTIGNAAGLIAKSDFNNYIDISNRDTVYNLVTNILRGTNFKMSQKTNFLDFFSQYYTALDQQVSEINLLNINHQIGIRSQGKANNYTLFIFSDCKHDKLYQNNLDSLEQDNYWLRDTLQKIEHLHLNIDINIIKTYEKNPSGIIETEKIIKEVFKSNATTYNVFERDFSIISDQRKTEPIFFFYPIPWTGKAIFTLSLDKVKDVSIRLSWGSNSLEFNPDFSFKAYDSDNRIINEPLRNHIYYNFDDNQEISKIQIFYEGSMVSQFPEIELSLVNRSLGARCNSNIYFAKVFNEITLIIISGIFCVLVILFFIIIRYSFKRVHSEYWNSTEQKVQIIPKERETNKRFDNINNILKQARVKKRKAL